MAYVVPLPADVKAAFPEFSAVGDGAIQGALDEAATVVDTSWSEDTFAVAYRLYAAHVLRLDGLGTSSQATLGAEMPFGVKRRRAGDTEIEVFSGGGNGGAAVGTAAWYQRTPYGQRFVMMQRRQSAGPRVYPSPLQAPIFDPFTP